MNKHMRVVGLFYVIFRNHNLLFLKDFKSKFITQKLKKIYILELLAESMNIQMN